MSNAFSSSGDQSESLSTGMSTRDDQPSKVKPITTYSELRNIASGGGVSEGLSTGVSEPGATTSIRQSSGSVSSSGSSSTKSTASKVAQELAQEYQQRPSNIPPATIYAQTEEEKKTIAREKSIVSRFARSFTRGFTDLSTKGLKETEEDIRRFPARGTGTQPEEIGLFTGGLSSFILTAESPAIIGEGAAQAKKAADLAKASKAGKVIQGIRSTALGRLSLDIPLTLGAQEIVGTAIEKVYKSKTLTNDQREIIKNIQGFDNIVTNAFEAEQSSVRQKGLLKAIGFEISPALTSDKTTFKQSVREQLENKGITGKDAETAIRAAENIRGSRVAGEAGRLLTVSTASEMIGQREVVRAVSKGVSVPAKGATFKLFEKFAKPIAQAGFVEGVTAEVGQQRARRDTRPFLPTTKDIKSLIISDKERGRAVDIIGSGAFGALSAGTIGGAIAATRPGAPAVSKTIELGAFVTDPFEKPGDILAEGIEKGTARIFKTTRRIPVITSTVKPSANVLTLSTKNIGINEDIIPIPTSAEISTGKSKPKGGGTISIGGKKPSTPDAEAPKIGIGISEEAPSKKKSPTSTITDVAEEIRNRVGVISDSSTQQPLPSLENILTVTQSPTPVPAPVSTPVNIPAIVQTPTPTIIETPTNINLPVSTPTSVFTFTPTNVPVNTPLLRIPPPLPSPFGSIAGGTSGSGKRGKQKIILPELAIGGQLLKEFSGVGQIFSYNKPKKKSKKKNILDNEFYIKKSKKSKKSKRSRKGVFDPLGIFG